MIGRSAHARCNTAFAGLPFGVRGISDRNTTWRGTMKRLMRVRQAVGIERLPGPQRHECLDIVFARCAGHGDDRAVLDRWMRDQHLFHLVRGHHLSAYPDPFAHAPGEMQIAVSVETRQVAGVKPQVAPAGQRGVRVTEIAARHDAGLAWTHDQLARLARRKQVVVRIVDADIVVVEYASGAGAVEAGQGDGTGVGRAIAAADPARRTPKRR